MLCILIYGVCFVMLQALHFHRCLPALVFSFLTIGVAQIGHFGTLIIAPRKINQLKQSIFIG